MGKEKMIKAIYEKVADKTLSFGCKIKLSSFNWIYENIDIDEFIIYDIVYNTDGKIFSINGHNIVDELDKTCKIQNKLEKIIGHPVMIGRCDLLIEKGPNYFDKWIEILDLWEKKDEPIEKQSDKCITKIYNLIK